MCCKYKHAPHVPDRFRRNNLPSKTEFSVQLITAALLQQISHPSLNTKFFAFLLNVILLGKKEFKAQRRIIFA